MNSIQGLGRRRPTCPPLLNSSPSVSIVYIHLSPPYLHSFKFITGRASLRSSWLSTNILTWSTSSVTLKFARLLSSCSGTSTLNDQSIVHRPQHVPNAFAVSIINGVSNPCVSGYVSMISWPYGSEIHFVERDVSLVSRDDYVSDTDLRYSSCVSFLFHEPRYGYRTFFAAPSYRPINGG
ncbi:hypothetical protein ARMGADRAFT_787389 [Armillaria gallica]|uniref:Uncharacterized protein n=1 Tax=Armillaria gallica TaxID=47427 RepID=A0A2H3DUJ1_ARMGA|nr:hypothetical protein ARMGADRAFT_787389 [Armillaria gallica]